MYSGAFGKRKGDEQVRRIMASGLLPDNVRSEFVEPRSGMTAAERKKHTREVIGWTDWKYGFHTELVEPWRAGVAPTWIRILLKGKSDTGKSMIASFLLPILPLWSPRDVLCIQARYYIPDHLPEFHWVKVDCISLKKVLAGPHHLMVPNLNFTDDRDDSTYNQRINEAVLREYFVQAKELAPCVLFIGE